MNNLRNTNSRLTVFILALAVLANWATLPSFSNSSMTLVFADATAMPELEDKAARARVSEAYGNLPISFEANQGQFDSRVKFVSRGNGCTMFLTASEAVFQLRVGASADKHISPAIEAENPKPATPDSQLAILKMKLVGASAAAVAQGMNELPGKVNYFIGNDSSKWRTGIATYAKAFFKHVYPGVDLVYYGNQRELEYDLKVAPGANLRAVRLAFEGARQIRVDKQGDLVLSTAAGETRQRKPIAYQEVNGARKEISARFVMKGARQVGFEIARYDTSKPLVIDPTLSYSTYLGGSSEESGNDIAVDAGGNAYIAGFTTSQDFPVAGNPIQPVTTDFFDCFVTKMNATGTALIYSTYLGGSNSDLANGIAVDAAGNAYVTGQTFASNFPTVNPIQPSPSGFGNAFVAKLNSTGSALVYSTYLGGDRLTDGQSIAVDAFGNAYVTGSTNSLNFPTANPVQPALKGSNDVFVTKINSAGTSFVYSTYIGGIASESTASIAVDSSGNAYVAGSTLSPDFPTVNALQPTFKTRTFAKSTNGANNWSSNYGGLPVHLRINALAVDPINTFTVYAATSGGGIFKSTNGGNAWSPINNGITITAINALAVNPVNPAILFATSLVGIFRSTDGGMSWSLNNDLNSTPIAIDPVNPANIYAGSGVFLDRSTDGGESWAQSLIANSPIGFINFITIDPSTPSTLYAGAGTLIFKSTDSGVTWNVKTQGLGPFLVTAMVIDPANTSTLYASLLGLIFKSTDGGEHWAFVSSVGGRVGSLVIDPVVTSTLYAGTIGEGVFKSTNSGNTWTAMNSGLGDLFVNALAIDRVNTSTLYAGGFEIGDGFVLKLNQNGSALVYSTYIGGDNSDSCSDIAVDASGNAYVTGTTTANNFPTVNSSRTYSGGLGDAFAFKLNSTGLALIYSTYIGGNNEDLGSGIAIDSSGNAYVTGSTTSENFPLVEPLQSSLGDFGSDAFVTKLNPTGTAFVYSTYLGGGLPDPNKDSGQDVGNAIAVDAGGNAYVTGETFSPTFPTTPGAFQITQPGSPDAFVSKISMFDICLQDDANGNLLEFNSTTGEYKFSNCRKKFTLTGRGTVSTKFCKVELKANAPGHSITASANTCVHNGSATVQVSAQRQTFTISDKNTTNNTCACQ